MLNCRFCGRELVNAGSLKVHENSCKLNPDRVAKSEKWLASMASRKGVGANHFIKAERLGLSKPIVSQETRQKIAEANKSRTKEWNIENGKRVSEAVNKLVEAGEWHTSLAKNMRYEYNGVILHGTWELRYAQFLTSVGTEWVRTKDRFSYEFEGKIRRYTPDFYLPQTNEYIEIKGFTTAKDIAKWDQFPANKKLIVLNKEKLEQLVGEKF